jgi:outer membrane protein TolC
MKILSIILAFLIHTTLVTGQSPNSSATTDTMRMTWQQCVEYALQNQVAVKNSRLDADISHRKTQEYTGIALPQISGTFNFADYLKLPTTLIPAEFTGGEPGTFVPLQFGTQYNGTAQVQLSQLVVDGRYFLGLRASKALAELSQKKVEQTEIETREKVIKAYLSALIAAKRAEQLEVNIKSFKKTYDDTKEIYNSGFIEKVDVDRIAVGYNNLLAEKEKIDEYVALSVYMLKFQMGMNINQPLVLTDSLREADFQSVLQNAAAPDINNRIEYQMLLNSRSLGEMNIKQYQYGYIPTLYATGSYSYQAQVNEFDLIPSSTWYNMAFIGFTFSLPIFDGFQKARQVQQARLSLNQTENNIADFQNAMTLQVASAKTSMQNAIEGLNVQKSNLELANEIVTISRKKFELGAGSSLEVTDAEKSLKDAQTNYLNALYDAWVARIDLEKALGTLK